MALTTCCEMGVHFIIAIPSSGLLLEEWAASVSVSILNVVSGLDMLRPRDRRDIGALKWQWSCFSPSGINAVSASMKMSPFTLKAHADLSTTLNSLTASNTAITALGSCNQSAWDEAKELKRQAQTVLQHFEDPFDGDGGESWAFGALFLIAPASTAVTLAVDPGFGKDLRKFHVRLVIIDSLQSSQSSMKSRISPELLDNLASLTASSVGSANLYTLVDGPRFLSLSLLLPLVAPALFSGVSSTSVESFALNPAQLAELRVPSQFVVATKRCSETSSIKERGRWSNLNEDSDCVTPYVDCRDNQSSLERADSLFWTIGVLSFSSLFRPSSICEGVIFGNGSGDHAESAALVLVVHALIELSCIPKVSCQQADLQDFLFEPLVLRVYDRVPSPPPRVQNGVLKSTDDTAVLAETVPKVRRGRPPQRQSCVKSCPGGHGLIRFVATETARCDNCGIEKSGWGQLFGCRACNFDLCSNCFRKKNPSMESHTTSAALEEEELAFPAFLDYLTARGLSALVAFASPQQTKASKIHKSGIGLEGSGLDSGLGERNDGLGGYMSGVLIPLSGLAALLRPCPFPDMRAQLPAEVMAGQMHTPVNVRPMDQHPEANLFSSVGLDPMMLDPRFPWPQLGSCKSRSTNTALYPTAETINARATVIGPTPASEFSRIQALRYELDRQIDQLASAARTNSELSDSNIISAAGATLGNDDNVIEMFAPMLAKTSSEILLVQKDKDKPLGPSEADIDAALSVESENVTAASKMTTSAAVASASEVVIPSFSSVKKAVKWFEGLFNSCVLAGCNIIDPRPSMLTPALCPEALVLGLLPRLLTCESCLESTVTASKVELSRSLPTEIFHKRAPQADVNGDFVVAATTDSLENAEPSCVTRVGLLDALGAFSAKKTLDALSKANEGSRATAKSKDVRDHNRRSSGKTVGGKAKSMKAGPSAAKITKQVSSSSNKLTGSTVGDSADGAVVREHVVLILLMLYLAKADNTRTASDIAPTATEDHLQGAGRRNAASEEGAQKSSAPAPGIGHTSKLKNKVAVERASGPPGWRRKGWVAWQHSLEALAERLKLLLNNPARLQASSRRLDRTSELNASSDTNFAATERDDDVGDINEVLRSDETMQGKIATSLIATIERQESAQVDQGEERATTDGVPYTSLDEFLRLGLASFMPFFPVQLRQLFEGLDYDDDELPVALREAVDFDGSVESDRRNHRHLGEMGDDSNGGEEVDVVQDEKDISSSSAEFEVMKEARSSPGPPPSLSMQALTVATLYAELSPPPVPVTSIDMLPPRSKLIRTNSGILPRAGVNSKGPVHVVMTATVLAKAKPLGIAASAKKKATANSEVSEVSNVVSAKRRAEITSDRREHKNTSKAGSGAAKSTKTSHGPAPPKKNNVELFPTQEEGSDRSQARPRVALGATIAQPRKRQRSMSVGDDDGGDGVLVGETPTKPSRPERIGVANSGARRDFRQSISAASDTSTSIESTPRRMTPRRRSTPSSNLSSSQLLVPESPTR